VACGYASLTPRLPVSTKGGNIMPIFEVTFFVEPRAADDEDIEIEERVIARDEEEALDLARQRLAEENPGIDPAKATAWFIERKTM
jgi:hypothetical protein